MHGDGNKQNSNFVSLLHVSLCEEDDSGIGARLKGS